MTEDVVTLPTLTGDHEADHVEEDRILWRIVYRLSTLSNDTFASGLVRDARALVDWDRANRDRTRWYA